MISGYITYAIYKTYSHHSEKKTMETRIIKNILYKKETTVCKQDRDGIVGRVNCVVPQ